MDPTFGKPMSSVTFKLIIFDTMRVQFVPFGAPIVSIFTLKMVFSSSLQIKFEYILLWTLTFLYPELNVNKDIVQCPNSYETVLPADCDAN